MISWDTPISELMNSDELQHSDDELYHWKYISKKRVNGKWRYKYDDDSKGGGKGEDKPLWAVEDGKTYYKNDGSSEYGKYTSGNDTLEIKKSNKLFSNKRVIQVSSGNFSRTTTIKEIGKLERSVNKAKNWVRSLFDRKITVNGKTTVQKGKISKTIDKGKKWIKKLFS